MSRSKRRTIAKETLQILERGHYTSSSGNQVSIAAAQRQAVANSRLYRPEELVDLRAAAENRLSERQSAPLSRIRIAEATTFAACKQLHEAGHDRTVCLNFASAKNPGGGFLGGSQAQEEALARASGLYPCLSANFDYYVYNRNQGGAIYSHHLIYAPEVPVIRDDVDALLEAAYPVSIITAPAVNVGALPAKKRTNKAMIREVMHERTEAVLAVALTNGHARIVLGAWGCGVFRNDPRDMAGYFRHFLAPGGKYERAFDEVIFAIPGFASSKGNLKGFREVWGEE
ncbi:MAG: TIGR02452 family protein [Bacteroidota bacterium]